MEKQNAPYATPDRANRFVGKGRGQRKPLDDLLPTDGIDAEDDDHAAVEQAKPQAEEALPRRNLAAYAAHGIDHENNMQKNIGL